MADLGARRGVPGEGVPGGPIGPGGAAGAAGAGEGGTPFVQVRTERGRPVVVLEGDVDITTAPALRAFFTRGDHGRRPGRTVLDLTRVAFIDSSGLGAIVHAHKRVRASGGDGAALVVHDASVRRVLQLAGLDRAVPLFTSLDEALDALDAADAPAPPAG